ncbi:type II/IV secretion system protein [Thiospirochaeta perfilievii]|uniref:Type II/IV secretion system protein n=1 Tax=Thiospirochaeta perfilievii TaxID=252967 RepID=A0A5C1QEJ1_9SPIO|nr:GspE/PulE family protein [Thiospirochaeta perfilievii]QEN05066.1 type II/IV secretion system protein [Thiospirochaeta perfilievii]
MEKPSLDDYKIYLKDIKQFPIPYIKTNGIIKLKEDETSVIIGYTSKLPLKKKSGLNHLLKDKTLEYIQINQSELTSYISKSDSSLSGDTQQNLQENDLNRLAHDAPVINLVNSIIIDGINLNASDIHIEGYKNHIDLRFRVDGVLIEGDSIKKSLFPGISSRIKIMANLNIMERRVPQDGRVSVKLEDTSVDLRISIVPISSGESIVLRLFIKKDNLKSLEDLGYRGDNLNRLKMVTKYPHGLILITGPTGSGKTTTLNAMLQELNCREKKIITIEDPVEYNIPGVNQIEVKANINLGFSDILRRVLRQDPDVIMIGEIRDKETAELVIRASLTGHLVLSTLHTNDAISVISRLKDLGIPDYLITSVLRASFAQRLIRKTCNSCQGSGCKSCLDSGYKGRIAISEGFLLNNKIEELILDRAKPYQIKKHLISQGFIDLYKAGDSLVNCGLTTKSELQRILS